MSGRLPEPEVANSRGSATELLARVPRRLGFNATTARLAILLGVVVYFSLTTDRFLTPLNLSNILVAASVVGIVAAALTLLLVAGQIDISVGSGVAFSAAVFAVTLIEFGWPLAVLAAFGASFILTAVNVTAIVRFGVPSIMVTLATLLAFRGAAKIVLDGRALPVREFGFLGQTRLSVFGLDVPLAILLLLAVTAFFFVLMKYTQFGQHMYALGANARASRLAGIPLERNVIIAYILTGVTVAIAALLLVSQTGVATPTTGDRLEFLALTGVMIGGASLYGGQGSVSGTLIAIVILAVFDNGLVLSQVPSFYQEVFRGALLLGALLFDTLRQQTRGVRMRP